LTPLQDRPSLRAALGSNRPRGSPRYVQPGRATSQPVGPTRVGPGPHLMREGRRCKDHQRLIQPQPAAGQPLGPTPAGPGPHLVRKRRQRRATARHFSSWRHRLIAVMRRIDAARPAAQRGHATPAGRSPALDLREPDSAAWTHPRRDLCYLEMVMLSCRLGTCVHLDHEFVLRRMRRRPQELSEARRRHGRNGQPGRRDESRR
jgi:hypothetical protein